MMSATRIGILLLGLSVMLILGAWGWTELANAVNNAPEVKPAVAALTAYGVAFLILIIGTGFTYFVWRFRNDDFA